MSKKPVAIFKRARINNFQQQIMLISLVTSLLFGVSLVLINYFFSTISFNSEIIEAQKKSARSYELVIKNIGICADKNHNGVYEESELRDCDPNKIAGGDVPGSLRHNIISMSNDAQLESVGRDSLSTCYGEDGKRIDFFNQIIQADNEKTRQSYIELSRHCSALRVISESLPFSGNRENSAALMASLNKIMLLSDWSPEKIEPSGEAVKIDVDRLGFMPTKFAIDAKPEVIHNIIENLERSIRTFDVNRANLRWSKKGSIELNVNSTAYYSEPESLIKSKKFIRSKSSNKKTNNSKKAKK